MSAVTRGSNRAGDSAALQGSTHLRRRKIRAEIARLLLFLGTGVSVVVLGNLLLTIWQDGQAFMSWHLVTEMPTSTVRRLDTSGYHNGLLGSIYLVATAALFAVPVGIGAAIYLEEYAPQNWLTKILQTNISNLAGVPSVVYGLLGLGVLVNFLGMGTFLGRSLLAGGITMGLLVMPLVIIASQEAIRAVPLSLRQGAFALGGTPWQVARSHVLPAALPGILTGVILAVARAFGETAPLIVAGASLYTSFVPNAPLDTYTVLPIQIFDYTTRAQAEFKNFAASGIVMLMTIVLLVNLAAIIIRERVGRRTRW